MLRISPSHVIARFSGLMSKRTNPLLIHLPEFREKKIQIIHSFRSNVIIGIELNHEGDVFVGFQGQSNNHGSTLLATPSIKSSGQKGYPVRSQSQGSSREPIACSKLDIPISSRCLVSRILLTKLFRMLACYRSHDRGSLKKICVTFLRSYSRGKGNDEAFIKKVLALPLDLQKAVFEDVFDFVK